MDGQKLDKPITVLAAAMDRRLGITPVAADDDDAKRLVVEPGHPVRRQQQRPLPCRPCRTVAGI